MSRALVIGGTLFIGRSLVEQLLERGDEVTVLHRSAGTPFGDRVGEILCDRNDVAAVEEALAGRRFDVVYDNVYDWERGTTAAQVAAAARAVGRGKPRYVFLSSIAVYGGGAELDEDSPLVGAEVANDYARNKAESERALFAMQYEERMAVTTLRPVFVYGRYNPFDREAFFWERILAGRPVIIPGDGSRPMQWVCSEDVARAAIVAGDADVAGGRAYNIAADPTVTQVEFVRALARAAGREVRMVHVPRRTLEAAGGGLFAPPFYFGVYLDLPPIVVRADRMRTELGLEPRPLEAGLRETFRWYSRQDRPVPDFSWEEEVIASL